MPVRHLPTRPTFRRSAMTAASLVASHLARGLRVAWFVALALAVAPVPTHAADPPATTTAVSYYRQIRPIFQEHCQGCHQPAKPLGNLVMTTYELSKKGGDSGELFVAGDADSSLLVDQITSHDGQPPAMPKDRPALTPDQLTLIRTWITEGASDDTPSTAVDRIDAAHPPVYEMLPVVAALDYSPDGTLLAVSGFHEVLLHRADGAGVVARLVGISERVESLAFSPDGSLLAVTGGSPSRFGEVQVWEVASRQLKLSVPLTFDTLFGVSWSHDGSKIAFGCTDNTVRAIDAATGQQVLFQGAHNDWVLDTLFSKDSSHLISVSRDRSMKLTEVATQRFVDNITSITPGALKGGLMCVDRHPTEDHLLVGGSDGTPKLYQTYRTKDRVIGDDFNLIREYEKMPGRLFAVEFSRDGNLMVASASDAGRGEVRVYQVADAKLLATAAGQKGPVYAVAFHPAGQEVASAGFDGLVRINAAASGELLREFPAAPTTSAAALPENTAAAP